jgi:hypothetical protein
MLYLMKRISPDDGGAATEKCWNMFLFYNNLFKNHYLACVVGTVLRQITPVLCFPENVYKFGFLNGVLRRTMLKYNHGLFSKQIIFSKTSRWAVGPT